MKERPSRFTLKQQKPEDFNVSTTKTRGGL
jgi:hypothetical protein